MIFTFSVSLLFKGLITLSCLEDMLYMTMSMQCHDTPAATKIQKTFFSRFLVILKQTKCSVDLEHITVWKS